MLKAMFAAYHPAKSPARVRVSMDILSALAPFLPPDASAVLTRQNQVESGWVDQHLVPTKLMHKMGLQRTKEFVSSIPTR